MYNTKIDSRLLNYSDALVLLAGELMNQLLADSLYLVEVSVGFQPVKKLVEITCTPVLDFHLFSTLVALSKR